MNLMFKVTKLQSFKRQTYSRAISIILFSLTIVLILTSFSLNLEPDQRIRYSINNNKWKFKKGDVKKGFKTSLDDKEWLNITIPHDFNGGSDGKHNDVFEGRYDSKNEANNYSMYKGSAWYRTEFTIKQEYRNKRIFIEFEAVSLEAKVWINGKEVGMHRGGYTAFSFDITDYIKYEKSNILAVRVDNSNNPQIAPWMKDEKRSFPFSFDYAVYGGIYRDVWITITDQVKIEKVFNTPLTGGQAPTMVSIDTKIKNYSKKSKEVTLSTTIVDPNGVEISVLKSKKAISPGEEITFNQSESNIGDVQLWSPDNPKLYKVKSEISYDGKAVDEFESIFGIRYYTLANKQAFNLNGKNLLLRGINRHQDIERLGYALKNEQHWEDAKIIKDAGFNFVRHAHYPCDPEFAKACNTLGLMLWLEIPYSGSTSEDPAFLQNCKEQMKEMIEQNYNNPSVIVWGVGNESDRSGGNETVSNKINRELVKVAKELDSDRPVTGCNFKYKSNKEIVDVYAPQNWDGWYGSTVSNYNPTSIIGEYGTSIHFPNHSEDTFDIKKNYHPANKTDIWSQEFGALAHEYKVSMGESKKDKFPGHCAWIAFDFASPRVDRKKNPIPFMNQKGLILHDHKTKKDVYYFYQSMYRKAKDFPMVYIVSHSWTDRWTEPGKKKIWVYSNCDSVELFNDYGKLSLGKRTKNAGPRGDTRFQWDEADIKFNVLYAEGWYNNKIVARDTIILKNLPVKSE